MHTILLVIKLKEFSQEHTNGLQQRTMKSERKSKMNCFNFKIMNNINNYFFYNLICFVPSIPFHLLSLSLSHSSSYSDNYGVCVFLCNITMATTIYDFCCIDQCSAVASN